jgi:hypothetical protein
MIRLPIRRLTRTPLRLTRTLIHSTFDLPTTESELDAYGPKKMRRADDEMDQSLMAEQVLALAHTHECLSEIFRNHGGLEKLSTLSVQSKEEFMEQLMAMTGDVSSFEELMEKIPVDEIFDQLKRISSRIDEQVKMTTFDTLEQNPPMGPRYGRPSSLMELIEKYKGTSDLKTTFLKEAAKALLMTPMTYFPTEWILSDLNKEPSNKNFSTLASIIGSTMTIRSESQLKCVIRAAVNSGDESLFERCLKQMRFIETSAHPHTFMERISKDAVGLPLSPYVLALNGLLDFEYPENEVILAIGHLLTGIVIDDTKNLRVRIYHDHRKMTIDDRTWELMPLSLVDALLRVGIKYENSKILNQCIGTLHGKMKTNAITKEKFFEVLQRLEKVIPNDDMLKLVQDLKA